MSYVETDDLVRWLLKAIMFGREGPSDHVQDFFFEQGDRPALRLRKLQVTDVGDPPDLALRRIGPDGAPWDLPREQFEAVPAGTNIGSIYWQRWDGQGFGVRQAQIYARTGPGNSGSLHLATTPEGGNEPVDRLSFGPDGLMDLGDVPLDTDDRGVFMLVRVHGQRAKLRLELIS